MESNYAFEIKTAKDLFLKLKRELNRLENEPLVSDHAMNFAITAHHLFADWLDKGRSPGFNSKLKKKYKEMIEYSIMEAICNGSKHFIRKERTTTIVDQSYVDNSDTGFPYKLDFAFQRSGLILMLSDGTEVEFIDVARNTVEFWQTHFDGLTN